ncbi:hypothetical protein [Flavobacterium psychrotolerans]|uniref:Uncharacterized protein n=1 Tax=Flavobacterium psychrotolerans TaxID=2169410 RepID=A0A2U1JJS2_9FLAO|nr:hypothetical protein [Flavobacterium psychrotolerans]PWA05255.1 hypothetical protein DB895_08125 [Flavobacterium psychrotolerans]
MATQKGLVLFEGTLGGINFYYRKGKAVARKAGGGFNGKAIKTKPSMIRVRENNSEFGHCSRIKKEIRMALFPFLMYYKEGTLHGRMMQLFQGIKNCDAISERGQRTVGKGISSPEGHKLFNDFKFTPKCFIASVVPMKASYNPVSCVYSVADFNINLVRFPKSATHLELQFGVLGTDFESIYTLFMAPVLIFEKGIEVADFTMTPTTLPDVGLHRFAFVGVTFYQELNGIKYVLRADGNIGVEVVEG